MSSIYYLKDGKVIRRVYKSLSELSTELRDMVEASRSAGSPYEQAELENKIQAAQARFDNLEAAINATGAYAGRRREGVTWIRMKNFLIRYAGAAPNALTMGLLPALEKYQDLRGSVDKTAEEIEQQEMLMLTEWKAYQVRLAAEWKTYQVIDRRTEEVTGKIVQLGKLKARVDLDTAATATKATAKAAAVAFQNEVKAAPADAKLDLVLARLASVEADLAASRSELTARNQQANEVNTVATVKEQGMEALVPKTPEQKQNVAAFAVWAGGMIGMLKELVGRPALNRTVRTSAGKLTTDIYNKMLGMDMKAENKVAFEKRYAELTGQQTKFEQKAAADEQNKMVNGQALAARMEALQGQHLLESARTRVIAAIESWGLGRNKSGATYYSLTKLVEQMEAANKNPRSKFYKK